ncbi:MAG TPA: M23 family metallopeptidase [Anaerolineales bacterium]|nr:M23 family metallopeptidase [Anaerolineales bacterium]
MPTTLAIPTSQGDMLQAIVRQVWLKTSITQQPNFDISQYTVESGDALFSIAKQFNIKPETLLWANSTVLKDSPDNIVPGETLVVPPTDGVYYQWKDGDTFDSVAKQFKANVDDILNWPGNNIDLSNPTVKPGTYIMIPGGQRELVDWIKPVVARGRSGTASLGGATCDGPIGSGAFVWPTANHYLSGNDFSSTHLGIDIAAGLGAPVYASDSGVVVVAGWSNSGYGNVVMIDHGNGYSTVYGHLSQIEVSLCAAVYRGTTLIGLAGSTGNSTGPHLHFEVRLNGGFVNPHTVLPPP